MKFDPSSIPANDVEKYHKYQERMFFSKADGGYPVGMANPHGDEHQEAIKKIFKEKLNTETSEILELPRRTLHYVYKVNTPKRVYIIRINAASEFYKELQFYVEAMAFERVKALGLSTIEAHVVDVSRSLVPYDYEITDQAAGQSIFDISQDHAVPLDLITQLGAYIGTVHRIQTKGFGAIKIQTLTEEKPQGIYATWNEFIGKNMENHLEMCMMAGDLESAIVNEATEFLKHLQDVSIDQPVLVHGDVANHNAFTDGKQMTALIDWEDCVSGDAVYDLAYYGTGCFGHDNWYAAFLAGYRSAHGLPPDYEKRYWLYYLRIAICKIVVRERFGSAVGTHLPNVRERVLYGLSQVKAILSIQSAH